MTEEISKEDIAILAKKKEIQEHMNGTSEQIKKVPTLQRELADLEEKKRKRIEFEALTPEEQKKQRKREFKSALITMAIVISLLGGIIGYCTYETEEEKIAKIEKQQEEERKKKEGEEQAAHVARMEKKKGFHCLSGWDGSHRGMKNSIKQILNAPKTFEHLSTKITVVNKNGEHTVTMDYTSENQLGGTVRSRAIAVINNSDCSVKKWLQTN